MRSGLLGVCSARSQTPSEPAFDQSVSARSGYVSDRRSEASARSVASSAATASAAVAAGARPATASSDAAPRVAFAASTTGGASIAGGTSSPSSTARSMLSTSRSGLSSTASAASSRAPVDTSKGYFPRPDSASSASASLSAALAGEQKEEDSQPPSSLRAPEDAADDAAAPAAAAALSSPAPVTKVKATAKSSPSATTTPTKKRVASATRSSPSSRPSTASSPHSTPVRASHYPKAAAAEPATLVRGTDFAFPLGEAPLPRKSSSSGVFKSFFGSPAAAAALEQDSQARVPVVAAPMGEFPLSPGTNARVKQMDTQARKAAAARREEESLRGSLRSSGSSSRISSRPGTAAQAGRDSSPLRGSNPRQSQSMSYSASAAHLPYNAASGSATASPPHSSFARRMIHAQSAAELGGLHSPPSQSQQQLDDDPDSSSLFFEGRNPGLSAADQEESRRLQELHNGTQGGSGSGSTLLVPYAANATNSYGGFSPSPASPQQARPNTAGVSSSGIAWSSKLTGPIPEERDRHSSPSKARPMTSSGLRGKPPPTLPSELMVGVADMPAHMQRDHAALARLIANLEPAGRGSLAGATVFSKLSTSSSRDALFNGKRSAYQEPSQILRLEQGTASDDLLRRRSIQKGIENQRQSSSALASRGAAGLAGNNLNGRAVAEAVAQTNADYPITDERPRNSRPATAHPAVGVAAALAAAGSPGATEIIGATVAGVTPSPQQQQRKLRPSTSSGGRPSTASTSGRGSGVLSLSDSSSSPLLLIPGMTLPSRGGAEAVLGFSGSIDRFGGSVEEMRFQGATTSATGGRGMMASKSATKLLASAIPTGAAGGVVEESSGASAQGSKRFNSLALEFEVALRERLVRIGSKKPASSSAASTSAAASGTQALERLDVFRTLLDDIILHSPVFGGLLAKVKAEYESYVRRGGESAAASGANDDLRAPRASAANANHQAIEDTLVLENHRLHSKLHGFQRAYTSLYAKYKSLLHQQTIQEGILSQNALVLADLNAQLQAAVLASMSDEERQMDALRREGFKLENETAEDAREIAARKQRLDAVGTLPDLGIDEDSDEDAADAADPNAKGDANPSSEAARRKAHAKKVARAKKAAAALLKAQTDPLEHGRQLMRQFQRPAGYVAPISALANAENEGDDLESEGAPIDPLKLAAFIEAGLGPSAGPGRGSGNPNDPASMLAPDPLEDLAQANRRQLLAARAEARRLQDELLATQTALEQSRTKEMQARMTMEEFSKQRYEFEKKAAAAAQQQAAAAVAQQQAQQQKKTASRPASFDSAAAPANAIPAHAMLANIVPSASPSASPSGSPGSRGSYVGSLPIIPALPLEAIAPGNSRGNFHSSSQEAAATDASAAAELDDDDPDNLLADDGGDGAEGMSEKDRVLAELQFQRQLVDSRMGIAAAAEAEAMAQAQAQAQAQTAATATAATGPVIPAAVRITPAASPSLSGTASPLVPVSRINSALLRAAEEADLAMLSEQTEQLTRKTSRSAYTLTGTVAEDNWFD